MQSCSTRSWRVMSGDQVPCDDLFLLRNDYFSMHDDVRPSVMSADFIHFLKPIKESRRTAAVIGRSDDVNRELDCRSSLGFWTNTAQPQTNPSVSFAAA